jgi:protein-S-isoprenylcysteine O-methyltransferase Ste14
LRPLPFSGGSLYALIFWIVYASWVLPEIIASRVKRSADSSKARDRGSLNLIVALWWGGMAVDFAMCLLLPQAAISWRRNSVFFAGIVLILAGVAFRWYSIAILGKYFTFDVAVHNNHTLIQEGPYRYIRHPSYSGALLSLVGFGLALGNWAGLALFLFCMGIAYSYRIPIEEAALAAGLGEPYRQYVSRTWRLIPFLF